MLAMSTSNARRFTPVAVNDTANANSGETIHIDVLVNDERLDDGVVELIVDTSTQFGGSAAEASHDFDEEDPESVAVLHVDYTSAPGFGGTDTFTYKIVDIHGDTSEPATVTVLVDGSISETTAGSHKVVFGGAAFPGSSVALSATGEEALTAGTSTVQCCTVKDTRVGADGTFQPAPFDLGFALQSADDEDCATMPAPAPDTLIVPAHFGVHTDDPDSTDPEDYRFGVCVVDTGVLWDGPVQVDIVAEPVVGYQVECKATPPATLPVDKQPLTLGLSAATDTEPAEFTSPEMRAITSECDPRGVTRWSTWWFVVNAVHLTDQLDSRTYVSRMAFVLKTMVETMRQEGVADSVFLNDVKTLVLNAQAAIGSKKWTPAEAISAMDTLDVATIRALTPPVGVMYSPTASFSNPKGELVSHLAALRYAVCSELAWPGALEECRMNESVDEALPQLP
jgi:hypothetical protein